MISNHKISFFCLKSIMVIARKQRETVNSYGRGRIQPCYIQPYQDTGFSQIISHTYMKSIKATIYTTAL